MVFKNNGPGGCCCDPCEGIDGVSDYTETFDSGTGTWDTPVGAWPPAAITNVSGRLNYQGNFQTHLAGKWMKCGSISNFTRSVECRTYISIPMPPPVGDSDAEVGPVLYGSQSLLTVYAAKLVRRVNRISGLDRYFISYGTGGLGNSGEVEITTPIPVDGDLLKIVETTNDYDAGDYDYEWFVNGVSVHSINSITIDKELGGGFDNPPCRSVAGIQIGGTRKVVEIDDFATSVTCD